MKEMDCVEVLVEKKEYADEGVHKGMQGWICIDDYTGNTRLVNFPQYGMKDDIAEISIHVDDLKLLPNGMNAKVNERIKAEFGD